MSVSPASGRAPVISVVIPVHNRPALAARAIRAALEQRGIAPDDLEIIVVDDASEPPLPQRDFGLAVQYLRLDCNRGAAGARNAGIVASQGEFIAFLDSDDVWLADKLAHQLAAHRQLDAQGDTGAGPVALTCSYYYPERTTGTLQLRTPKSATVLTDFVSGCTFCPGSTLFVRRSEFDRVGPLDETLRRLEDVEWFIRFGRLGGRLHVMTTPDVIIAPANAFGFKSVALAGEKIVASIVRQDAPPLTSREWRRLRSYLAMEHAAGHLRDGERLKSLGCILASLWHQPRLRPSVSDFWQRSSNVPHEVLATYSEMIEASEH